MSNQDGGCLFALPCHVVSGSVGINGLLCMPECKSYGMGAMVDKLGHPHSRNRQIPGSGVCCCLPLGEFPMGATLLVWLCSTGITTLTLHS